MTTTHTVYQITEEKKKKILAHLLGIVCAVLSVDVKIVTLHMEGKKYIYKNVRSLVVMDGAPNQMEWSLTVYLIHKATCNSHWVTVTHF